MYCLAHIVLVLSLPLASAANDDYTHEARKGLLRVLVTIGTSKPLHIVVDTGSAATLIINRREAENRGWKISGSASLSGAGATHCNAQVTEALRADVAGTSLPPTEVYLLTFAHIEKFLKSRIEGVIGGAFFEGRVLRLDYRHNTVVDLATDTTFDPGYRAVPLRRAAGHCCHVTATLVFAGRSVTGDFLVDTGAPVAQVLIAPEFASRNGIKAGSNELEFPGLCAMSRFSRLDSRATLRLGDVSLEQVQVLISHDREGAFATGGFDGVIGGRVLRRFSDVVVDTRRSSLLLRR